MSQVSHPAVPLRSQVQAQRAMWLAALVALVATVAVTLLLAIDGVPASTSPAAGHRLTAPRSDGIQIRGSDEASSMGRTDR